jgi:hypothetical protein
MKKLFFVGLFFFTFTFSTTLTAQLKGENSNALNSINNFVQEDSAVLQSVQFTEESMKEQWNSFNKDKGWTELVRQAEQKGFKRIEKSSWGFKGTLKNVKTGKSEEVMFCAFDFYSPSQVKEKSFQTCSMVWRKVGKDVYKAYIVFPKGESNQQKSFAGADEWFADASGTVQKAHSFNKCFNGCINGGKHSVFIKTIFGSVKVSADCKSQCLGAVAVCGGVTAILELASGGLGTPVLIATFGICAGVACGQCFAMCALGCS